MPPGDYAKGADCLTCFAPGETPAKVYARFSGLTACPPGFGRTCKTPPNDRVFTVPQDPISPCSYYYADANWMVGFTFALWGPHRSWLSLMDVPGYLYFSGTTPGCMSEDHVFTNEHVACGPLVCCYTGIGIVSWTENAYKLLADINLSAAYDLFMEKWPKANGDVVYKFCKTLDHTNIKILISP